MAEFKVKVLEAEVPTHKGRIFSKEVLKKAVKDFKKRRLVSGPVIGEIAHPERTVLASSLGNATHLVKDVTLEKGTLKATIETLSSNNPTLNACLKEGQFAVRGTGNVDSTGRVTDFHLISVDLVR